MQVAPYERVSFARSLTAEIVQRFWGTLVRGWGSSLPVRKPGALWPGRRLTREDTQLAASLAGVTAERGVLEGGHLIGTIYTAALPDEYRSRHGAYYTPPAISERLIDLASTTDLDWKSARVLDPACGGAAFLAPLAFRMLRALRRPSDVAGHRRLLKHIAEKLRGFEIDSFAAWLSEVLVEAAVLDSVIACGERLPRIVDVRDSLRAFEPQGQFDLIIGNPPYGRVRISDRQRVQFRRSLLADLAGRKSLLVFAEVVATDGAITEARKVELMALAGETGFSRKNIAFVTVFQDRESAAAKRAYPHLAWGSFAWYSSEPEHIVLLTGEARVERSRIRNLLSESR